MILTAAIRNKEMSQNLEFSSDNFSMKKDHIKHVVVEASVTFEISSEYVIIMIGYPELVYNTG